MDPILTNKTKEVYLWTGRVIHIVDLDRPRYPEEVDVRRTALCGFKPLWPGEWIEYLPNSGDAPVFSSCLTCERIKGVSGERQP